MHLALALKCVTLKRSACCLDWMKTPSSMPLKSSSSIADKNMENNVGANTQPCLTLFVTSNGLDVATPSVILLSSLCEVIRSYAWTSQDIHTSSVVSTVLSSYCIKGLCSSTWSIYRLMYCFSVLLNITGTAKTLLLEINVISRKTSSKCAHWNDVFFLPISVQNLICFIILPI